LATTQDNTQMYFIHTLVDMLPLCMCNNTYTYMYFIPALVKI